jgi:hypothetical protein
MGYSATPNNRDRAVLLFADWRTRRRPAGSPGLRVLSRLDRRQTRNNTIWAVFYAEA